MYICKKCKREFSRKCDLSRHLNTCGNMYLHMGYECFIDKDGNEKFVHREVLEKKLGRKLRDNENAHHIDENKRNNDPDNLEVLLISEHTKKHRKEYTNSAETNKKISKSKIKNWQNIHGVKLNPILVKEIKIKLQNKVKMTVLSKEYNVGYDTIRDIKNNKTWKFV